MVNIIDLIGTPALLEQTAEECVELAHVCLKYARKNRGENPTPKELDDIIAELEEEIADVSLCIEELLRSGIIDIKAIEEISEKKLKRWRERLLEKHEKIK